MTDEPAGGAAMSSRSSLSGMFVTRTWDHQVSKVALERDLFFVVCLPCVQCVCSCVYVSVYDVYV